MTVIFVMRLINSSIIQLCKAALKLSLGWDAKVLLNLVSWKYPLERAGVLPQHTNMSLNLCATHVSAYYTITPWIYLVCRAELSCTYIISNTSDRVIACPVAEMLSLCINIENRIYVMCVIFLFSISISVTSSKYIKYIRDIIFWLYRLSQSVVFRKFFFYNVSIFKFSVYITVSLFFTWLFKFSDFWKFVHNFLIFCLSPFHTLIYFRDFEFFSRMDYIFCSLLFRRLIYHAYNRILFLRKDRSFYRSSYRFCDVLYNCLYITIYVYILYHPLLSGSRSYSIIVSKINYVLLVILSSGVDYSRPDD